MTSRSGSIPQPRATCSNNRSRTLRHTASTAPPLIHVWRDADVDPAKPTVVSMRSTTTSSTPGRSLAVNDLLARNDAHGVGHVVRVVLDLDVDRVDRDVGGVGLTHAVVLGHDECGAVSAAIESTTADAPALPPHIWRL